VLIENRNGLIVSAMVTQADGTAERDAALLMLYKQWRSGRPQRRTASISVGADKAYDTRDFVDGPRDGSPTARHTEPQAARRQHHRRADRHASYQVSQQKRPLIEKAFGWMKQTGGMRKTKLRRLAKVGWQFLMTAAAFSLLRLPKIQAVGV
jgi:Transposase DDE domain